LQFIFFSLNFNESIEQTSCQDHFVNFAVLFISLQTINIDSIRSRDHSSVFVFSNVMRKFPKVSCSYDCPNLQDLYYGNTGKLGKHNTEGSRRLNVEDLQLTVRQTSQN